MFRYIIIIWNVNDASDCDAVSNIRRRVQRSAVDWRPALDRPGMYVACVDRQFSSGAAILVDDWRGVILGTLFRSPGNSCSSRPTSIRHLSRGDSEEILQSMGRSLISNFWGYYVAALHYPENASAVVLRGPVSPLACFHVEQGTVNIFFSRLDDCIDLKVTPLSINWDSITAQVVGGDYLTNETAIKEIDSIECGESIRCNPGDSSKHVYWDPRLFLEQRTPKSFDEAARDVRRTTEYCVGALSSPHHSILVIRRTGLIDRSEFAESSSA